MAHPLILLEATEVVVRKYRLKVMKKLVDVVQDKKSKFDHEGHRYIDIGLAQVNRAAPKAYAPML